MYNEIVLKIKARENVKMRIIIFGTGKISMRFLSKLKKDIEIAAFLDNDPSKWEGPGNKGGSDPQPVCC